MTSQYNFQTSFDSKPLGAASQLIEDNPKQTAFSAFRDIERLINRTIYRTIHRTQNNT